MQDKKPGSSVLDEAFLAIADGTPLPWQALHSRDENSPYLDVLKLLHDVASAHRGSESPKALIARRLLFRWDRLEVEALIGTGSNSEVYRAYDPWLARHVALKLSRADDAGNDFGEARRLAQLRHPNILGVYGCAVQEQRAGLWTEFIDGRTLGDIVTTDGPLSQEETTRIGYELALALTVVHAAGLVHGDIKADNIMRERGGRIVLMDFGAGGEQRLMASRRLLQGTPIYLAPEVVDGSPMAQPGDVYAVGVLLYFLLSGRYPYAVSDVTSLHRLQQRHEATPLMQLRPDSSPELLQTVESCFDANPAQRPTAAALLTRLRSMVDRSPVVAGKFSSWRSIPLVITTLLLVAFVFFAGAKMVESPWQSSATFFLASPGGDVALTPESSLAAGDHLRLGLTSTRAAFIYVLNEDAAGNATLLTPAAKHGPVRVSPGQTTVLPDETSAWEVSSDSSREEFVVIATLVPVPALTNALAEWKRVRGDQDTRAVGKIVHDSLPLIRGTALRTILDRLGDDPQHVRVWQYSFAHRSAR